VIAIDAETTSASTGADLIRLPAEHQELGFYLKADGFFFNPFVDKFYACWDAATTCVANVGQAAGSGTAADFALWDYIQSNVSGATGSATGVANFNMDRSPAGNPGNVSVWTPNYNGGFSQLQSQESGAVLQFALNGLEKITEKYDTDLTAYNASVATYNTAVTAYNTAVKARDDGTAESDAVIPTVGAAPLAVANVFAAALKYDVYDAKASSVPYTNAEQKVALTPTTGFTPTVDATHVFYENQFEYATTNNVKTPVVADIDARRKGYIHSNKNGLTTETATFAGDSVYAGKVFGRLGQGKQNDPASALGWRIKSTATVTGDNLMQVSVLPDSGTNFKPIGTAVAAAGTVAAYTPAINLEAKIIGAASKSYVVPAALATALTAVTPLNLTGATALAASTLAVAAAAAALY